MPTERFRYLFEQYLHKRYTPAEREEFLMRVSDPANHAQLEQLSGEYNLLEAHSIAPELGEEVSEQIVTAILRTASHNGTSDAPRPIRGLQWVKYAAAILLLSAGAWFYQWKQQDREIGTKNPVTSQQNDPAPGTNGAILTLADGTQVVLDSLGNRVIANEQGTQVRLEDGQLMYDPSKVNSGEITFNTMTTPKGKQFQLTLSDGTQVWLNAASSLRYPTLFSGKERQVYVDGEAYFEVAKNAKVPFRVTVTNKLNIEVLGTHFNVQAYTNENSIQTTLLEGSVKVNGSVLKPGQQAQVDEKLHIVDNVNTEKVMAWKNGFFNFEGMGVEELMRQISRWYNVEVIYENGIPDKRFVGEVSRNMRLSSLLKILEEVGVRFRVEGRNLIVM